MMMKSAIAAALLGSAIIAAPASASPAAAPSERVLYADLDLTTATGMAELDKRVKQAAWRVCKFAQDGSMRTRGSQVECYRSARRTSATMMAAAAGEHQHRKQQLAQLDRR